MGNNHTEESNQAHMNGSKVVLKLRYRDIILHYSFKMKLTIADIGLFPDHMQGLRLWDSDIVLSRFVILENQIFKNKDIMVFKAGVGITGITISKWGGPKSITMCDFRKQVVENMKRNCDINQAKNVLNVLINISQFGSYPETYDVVVCTDLFGDGFLPQAIINIWRKLLRVGGEAIMILPDKKEESKKLLELIDKTEFRITNLVLTAEQYEASPIFNKLEAESEFPQLGKSTFYAICLKKIKQINTIKISQEQKSKGANKEQDNQIKILKNKEIKQQQMEEQQEQREQKKSPQLKQNENNKSKESEDIKKQDIQLEKEIKKEQNKSIKQDIQNKQENKNINDINEQEREKEREDSLNEQSKEKCDLNVQIKEEEREVDLNEQGKQKEREDNVNEQTKQKEREDSLNEQGKEKEREDSLNEQGKEKDNLNEQKKEREREREDDLKEQIKKEEDDLQEQEKQNEKQTEEKGTTIPQENIQEQKQ